MSKALEILGAPALVSPLSGHQFYTKEWVLAKMEAYALACLERAAEKAKVEHVSDYTSATLMRAVVDKESITSKDNLV